MNTFCGPYAISHTLGVSISEATRQIREITGKRSVFGVHPNVITALLGVEPKHCVPRYTVAAFAETYPTGKHVLATNNHFMVLDNGRIYDNGGTAPAAQHYLRRRWLQMVWHVYD